MSLLKDISELLHAEIITQETADRIQVYYKNKKGSSTNRLFIVFGILGAILVGLGIILIIAHNWDELSQTTKSFFAFLPLLAGQGFCIYSILKKQNNVAWKESAAAFLFFSVGACISLISQIYNIPGSLSSFLFTWMLLCLPLIYIMQSSIASLLYLIGITYYASQIGYWTFPSSESYLYWMLLIFAMPHFFLLHKNNPKSNFTIIHNWFVPLSVVIALGTVNDQIGELMYVAYMSLFGLFYLIGVTVPFPSQKIMNNGFKILGTLGTIVLLFILSFDWFWEGLRNKSLPLNELLTAPEFFASAIITVLAIGLLAFHQKGKLLKDIDPFSLVFIVLIITFVFGLSSQISFALINLYVFIIGILKVREGAKQDSLGVLNFGLIIISALIGCRFFDTDLSFVVRGLLFVSVGAGFFITNYWMLKKRKANEQ